MIKMALVNELRNINENLKIVIQLLEKILSEVQEIKSKMPT